jgi:hypothetical protein
LEVIYSNFLNLISAWEYNLKSQAIQLGYSTELKSQQIEMPYGLLEYLK